MRVFRSNGSTKVDPSLERDIGKDIQNLARTNATLRHRDNGDDEKSANNLAALFRRVTEASTREVEGLIDQLQELREKLDSDGENIKSYFSRYEGLSQGVMQLATIISDNVKRLPCGVPGSENETHSSDVVMETATAQSPEPLSPLSSA